MKRFWMKRAAGFIVLILAAAALFSFIVMALWNNILVPVLHIGVISFWQALGILVLSKILFSGFGRRRHWGYSGERNHQWRKQMQEKWHNMTQEEREKFKQEWKSRCRSWRMPETPKQEQAGTE